MRKTLRKIYQELVAIRKEIQTRNKNGMLSLEDLNIIREPYQTVRTEFRRFQLLTENEVEKNRLEKLIADKKLSRQEIAIILFGLRVRPEFGKKDFGI